MFLAVVGGKRSLQPLPSMLRDAGTDPDGWTPSLSSWSQPSSFLSSYHRRPWLTVASQRGRFLSAHPLWKWFFPWNAQSCWYGSEDWSKQPKCAVASQLNLVHLALATTLCDWLHPFSNCMMIVDMFVCICRLSSPKLVQLTFVTDCVQFSNSAVAHNAVAATPHLHTPTKPSIFFI